MILLTLFITGIFIMAHLTERYIAVPVMHIIYINHTKKISHISIPLHPVHLSAKIWPEGIFRHSQLSLKLMRSIIWIYVNSWFGNVNIWHKLMTPSLLQLTFRWGSKINLCLKFEKLASTYDCHHLQMCVACGSDHSGDRNTNCYTSQIETINNVACYTSLLCLCSSQTDAFW